MLPDMDERIQAAAEEMEKIMLPLHQDDRGVHVNSLLSTVAAVTGEAILRAVSNLDQLYAEQGPIFSLGAEDVLFGAREGSVMNYIGFTARESGLAAADMPDIIAIMQHTSSMMSKVSIMDVPVLTIPEDQHPHFWALGGAAASRQKVLDIYARFTLKPLEAVLASTLLLCRLLHSTRDVLLPKYAFRLVMETLVGGIRLHPMSVEAIEQMAQS